MTLLTHAGGMMIVRKVKCDDCGELKECRRYADTFIWICLMCAVSRSSEGVNSDEGLRQVAKDALSNLQSKLSTNNTETSDQN